MEYEAAAADAAVAAAATSSAAAFLAAACGDEGTWLEGKHLHTTHARFRSHTTLNVITVKPG
jgi:hypothetical protein